MQAIGTPPRSTALHDASETSPTLTGTSAAKREAHRRPVLIRKPARTSAYASTRSLPGARMRIAGGWIHRSTSSAVAPKISPTLTVNSAAAEAATETATEIESMAEIKTRARADPTEKLAGTSTFAGTYSSLPAKRWTGDGWRRC